MEIGVVILIVVAIILLVLLIMAFSGANTVIRESEIKSQACPKCNNASDFYRQPIHIEHPRYTESGQVNFCRKCDVEVLPRVLL